MCDWHTFAVYLILIRRSVWWKRGYSSWDYSIYLWWIWSVFLRTEFSWALPASVRFASCKCRSTSKWLWLCSFFTLVSFLHLVSHWEVQSADVKPCGPSRSQPESCWASLLASLNPVSTAGCCRDALPDVISEPRFVSVSQISASFGTLGRCVLKAKHKTHIDPALRDQSPAYFQHHLRVQSRQLALHELFPLRLARFVPL